MKEITVLNKIDKMIESIDYKTAYIEIHASKNKYIIEKVKKNIGIGFKTE